MVVQVWAADAPSEGVQLPSGSYTPENRVEAIRNAATDRRAMDLACLPGEDGQSRRLERVLSDDFLSQNNPEELGAILDTYNKVYGDIQEVLPIEKTRESNKYWFVTDSHAIPIELAVTSSAPYRIDAVWLGSPIPLYRAIERTVYRLQEDLPGEISLVVYDTDSGRELYSFQPRLRLGASPLRPFLIFYAVESARVSGGPGPEYVVRLRSQPRTGVLQGLPEGSPVTVHTLMAAAFRGDRYAVSVLSSEIPERFLSRYGAGPESRGSRGVMVSAETLLEYTRPAPAVRSVPGAESGIPRIGQGDGPGTHRSGQAGVRADGPGLPVTGPAAPGADLLVSRVTGYGAAGSREAAAVLFLELSNGRRLTVTAVWNHATAGSDQRRFFDLILSLPVLLGIQDQDQDQDRDETQN
jgi:hypothetical protein